MEFSVNDCDRIRRQLDAGVNIIDQVGDTLLHAAIREQKIDSATLLIELGADVTIPNNNGDTPLHYAARFSQVTIVQLLLTSGANVNARNKQGDTPLHTSCYNPENWKEMALLLLIAGADIDAQNLEGLTVLHYVIINNNIDEIRFFLDHGASTDIQNIEYETVMNMAKDAAVVTLLQKHIAGQDVINAVAMFRQERIASQGVKNTDRRK